MPSLYFDNVTLKQFRNPEAPDLACYQALVKSKMGVDRVNRAGLLGDVNLLRGDTSGGYSIRIHQYDAQPIIQTLGLAVDSWVRVGGASVALLKPVLPYWLDVDLYYGKGELICSRARGAASEAAGYWRDEQRDAVAQPPPTAENCTPPLYNNALGAATQPIVGPFHFPDVTLQVYPLLADREKLEEVLKGYLNDPLAEGGMKGVDGAERRGWRFETMGAYVYMMVTVYGDDMGQMWSGTNNIGGFFDREVTFTVPVKWYDENDELITIGMIEPFTYSNNSRAVATDREVNGYNSIRANIESPRDVWLSAGGPIAKRQFLQLETEVIPALNAGQKAQTRTLIEVVERHSLSDASDANWRMIADTWGRTAIEDLKRKHYEGLAEKAVIDDVKALALEVLVGGGAFNRVIVKQYRDGEELGQACYQAIVKAASTITSIYDIREIDPFIHVRMHRQPGHPIVEALGLVVKDQESGDDVIDILQPLRPFWMRVAMTEPLATVAAYRAEDAAWQIVHPEFDVATAAAPGAERPYFRRRGPTQVGAWLARTPPGRPIGMRPSGAESESLIDPGKLDAWLRDRLDSEIAGADLHVNLKNEADQWLRRSLANQLAWSRLGFAGLADDAARGAVIARLDAGAFDPGVKALLTCNLAPGSLFAFCDERSTLELKRIRSGLDELAPPWESAVPPDMDTAHPDRTETFPGVTYSDGSVFAGSAFSEAMATVAPLLGALLNETTRGVDAAMLAWAWKDFLDSTVTSTSLMKSLLTLQTLPPDRALALSLLFPAQGLTMLSDLVAYAPTALKQINAIPDQPGGESVAQAAQASRIDVAALGEGIAKLKEASRLSDLLDTCVMDWVAPSRWRPVTYDEARASISALPDVQLVIDNILSSEWESRAPDTRWVNPKGGRKPDACLRDSPDIALFGSEQGIVLWTDPETDQPGDLWVVSDAAPAASGPS
jgi:hypothetical protein